jgi:hypothetical protein|tara:strand:- start:87 stop:281 length:195 start_codon:yes stop_codon:yes gene_type:complete
MENLLRNKNIMEAFLDFMQLFYEFMSYFGHEHKGWADFNGDGFCGSADLIEFLSQYQPLSEFKG